MSSEPAPSDRQEAPDPTDRGSGDDAMFAAVLGCFILSGFAALLYQTAWMRQFSVVFGTSELAVATVLASYMAGLALGAAIAGRFVTRVHRPVLVYGLLELGIAVTALAVPLALTLARGIQAAVLGGQAEPPHAGGTVNAIFYLGCAFVVLALPTAFMGATLPLLTRHAVRRREQIGRRVGLLYATNTGGAVLGTLTAAFVLLPAIGLWGTLLVGAAVNAAVFVLATMIARGSRAVDDPRPAPTPGERVARPGLLNDRTAWVLPLMLVSGAVSFTYEVLWTRLLGHLLGASIFAFATMLASFLVGITIGSAFASRFATTRDRSAVGLAIVQLGTALLSIGIYFGLDTLPALAANLGAGEQASVLSNLALAGAVLLPATLCIGATFPFAVRVLARSEDDAGPASARVYAWNTAGAIGGAILAGFVLIPALNFNGATQLAVATNLALAIAAILLYSKLSPRPIVVAGVAALSVASFAVVGLVPLFRPPWPERVLRSSPLPQNTGRGRIVYRGVGRSATVLMLEHDGSFLLRTNGHPESMIRLRGSFLGLETARWLSALPALARPEAKSMMIVGFGGGLTVAGVPPSIDEVHVIELEGEVIEANEAVADLRMEDPLSDPRVDVMLNDARGALAVTDRRYDIIVSQPSHPWTAGASHLYTREFMSEVRDHLTADGVFVQWMNARFMDEGLLKMLGATLLDVYAHVRVYNPDPRMLLFLASDQPIELEEMLDRHRDILETDAAHFRTLGIRIPEDVAVRLMYESPALTELCRGAPINTDNRNRFATHAPRAIATPLGPEGLRSLAAPFEPFVVPESSLNRPGAPAFDRVYIVARLLGIRQADRAKAVTNAIPDPGRQLLAQGLIERALGRTDEGQRFIERSLVANPEDLNARYALISPHVQDLGRGTAPADIASEVPPATTPEGAVIEAARRAHEHDWDGMRDLDDVLAKARPNDLCFNEATRLRVLWRLRTIQPQNRAERAAEAQWLIDRILPIDMTWSMFDLRAKAAVQADDPYTLLETVSAMTGQLVNEARTLPVGERGGIAKTSNQLLKILSGLATDSRISRHRFEEIKGRVEMLASLR